MRIKSYFFLSFFTLSFFQHSMCDEALAVCGGTSPNRVAASVSRADVLDCVNASTAGDTITVPAGTSTWASAIALPAKDLEIIGATVISCSGGSSSSSPITCSAVDNTTITCPMCFTVNLQVTQRISGFTMLGASDGGIGSIDNQNPLKHFRVDHNRIVSNSGWAPMEIAGDSNAVHPQGIFDHNILVDIAVHSNGTAYGWDDSCSTCQHQLWAQATPLGNSQAVIYIEANHFQNTANNVNSADSNYGGRYVFRFNNITSGRHTVEVHGMQGENRGSQRTEIYHNAASGLTGFSGTTFFRGGSGVIFGNRQASEFSFGVLFANDRSEYDDPIDGVGFCDGTHIGVDQNVPGQSGWRCRDQIGVVGDAVQWQHSPTFGAWNQILAPIYIFDNMTGGSQMSVEIDNAGNAALHIQANRDYYSYIQNFSGTSSVGSGPIALRPALCTAGVAYWATDEGEWNSLSAGPDGRLYKCTATNTWTLYFTPYTYPHPWTQSNNILSVPLAAPQNLRVMQ
jgi:hypothetical protein